jgi:hypothetical protein
VRRARTEQPDQGNAKTANRSQQGDGSGCFVGQRHVRPGMPDSADDQQQEAKEGDGEEKRDDARDKSNAGAQEKLLHKRPAGSISSLYVRIIA